MTSTDMATTLAPHVLRDYALLADGQRGALVGPRGDIAWMCAPRWDSDGVFSSLIGGCGSYVVTPTGRFVWGGHYEDGSLIWRSRWITDSGIVECREALAFPGDPHRTVLLRRIIAVRAPRTSTWSWTRLPGSADTTCVSYTATPTGAGAASWVGCGCAGPVAPRRRSASRAATGNSTPP